MAFLAMILIGLSILYWFYFLQQENSREENRILLSILYWFYFLRECPVLQVNAGRTFNPILVLFSPFQLPSSPDLSYFQSYIGSIFSLLAASEVTWIQRFQSYIGSIFSISSNVSLLTQPPFNPILVLFSHYINWLKC